MKTTIEHPSDEDAVQVTIHTSNGDVSIRVDDGWREITYIGVHLDGESLLSRWAPIYEK